MYYVKHNILTRGIPLAVRKLLNCILSSEEI